MSGKIAPSILSADFMRITEEIGMAETANADYIHCDVMDGHFVPNLTFGPPVIHQIHNITSCPLDVHLMISNPESTIDQYIKSGAACLSFHYEATHHHHRLIQTIREQGVRAGIALNPSTPIWLLEDLLPDLDFVLIMSVNPGFGGQNYIPQMTDKIIRLDKMTKGMKKNGFKIHVDGGINSNTIANLYQAGADVFIAGSAVFKSAHPAEEIKKMKELIR